VIVATLMTALVGAALPVAAYRPYESTDAGRLE
jgi:hypothetical protein